jgi:dihydrofolate reductase
LSTSKYPQLRIGLIWAQSRQGVIGLKGQMPWHLPEDLVHFKRTTGHYPVVMGRKTWESLPSKFRPLPGRRNLVLSRDASHAQTITNAGAEVFQSLDACLAHLNAELDSSRNASQGDQTQTDPQTVWIIGGAQIYAQAVEWADLLVVTEIDADFEGDAFAPAIDPQWKVTDREQHASAQGFGYGFVRFERKR